MPQASRNTIASLLAFTFVTGMIDAASLLGAGRVFVANMTGNIVFIGFSLVGQGYSSLQTSALALLGFLGGALFGGRAMRGRPERGLRGGLAFDVVLLLCAGCLASFWPGFEVNVLVVLLALGMGARTAVVRSLAIPDLTTTVLTLTLAALAADSAAAGGDSLRFGRRLASVLLLLAGACVGALLFSVAPHQMILAAALLEGAAALALALSLPRLTKDKETSLRA